MEWYYANANGEQCGPHTDAELEKLITDKTVNANTMVWSEGMADWQPARDTPLRPKFPASLPPPIIQALPTGTGGTQVQPSAPALSAPQSGKKRVFPGQAEYVEEVAQHVENLLKLEKLETQRVADSSAVIVQGAQTGSKWQKGLRKVAGLELAVTVAVAAKGNNLEMVIGAGKWMDKAIGGVVGFALFAPVWLSTGWGIYVQQKLFNKIETEVEQYLAARN